MCDCETWLQPRIRIASRVYPGRVSWDILSRPYGTGFSLQAAQEIRYVLGYS